MSKEYEICKCGGTATKSCHWQQPSNGDGNIDDQKHFDFRRKMVKRWKKEDHFFLVNPYYSALRRVCIIIGVWPYETRKKRGLRFYLIFFLFTFLLIGQILSCFAMDYKFSTFTESFLTLGPTITVASGYYCINNKRIYLLRTMLNQIRKDWNHLQTAKELAIAHKYAEETRFNIHLYLSMCCLLIMHITLMPVILVTVNFIVKGNIIHQRVWPFRLEFFLIINQEEHLLSCAFMFSILFILLIAVFSANLGMVLALMHHACGMFRIVGVVFESAFEKKGLSSNELDEEMISATLFRAIVYHNRVIKFVNKLNSLYDTPYLINIVFGNTILGIDMIMLLQFDFNMGNKQKCFALVIHTIGIFSIGLSQCYQGQKLLDHSINVFEETSIMPWYTLSPRLQKLSLLIMMRSKKHCSLTIGKFFTPSHELFTKAFHFAASYAMVYHSTQNT